MFMSGGAIAVLLMRFVYFIGDSSTKQTGWHENASPPTPHPRVDAGQAFATGDVLAVVRSMEGELVPPRD